FEPTNGPGSGKIGFRQIREKRVQQLATNEDVIRNMSTVMDVLLSMPDVPAARRFSEKLQTIVAAACSDKRALEALVSLYHAVVMACEGTRPSLYSRFVLVRKLRK